MPEGRPPKPTSLKLIKGTQDSRWKNDKEAVVALAEPTPPSFMSDDAKVEWGRVVGTLYRAGLMTEIDRAALAAYCQSYGRWAQAERALAKAAELDEENFGLLTETSNGNAIQNPLVGIANKAKADVVRFATEFGMTPSARSRVSANPDEQKQEDRAAKYF